MNILINKNNLNYGTDGYGTEVYPCHLRDILSHGNVKKHTTLKPNVEDILIYINLLQRQVYLFILGIVVWINC